MSVDAFVKTCARRFSVEPDVVQVIEVKERKSEKREREREREKGEEEGERKRAERGGRRGGKECHVTALMCSSSDARP